jgi:hypothetical protein
VSWPILSLAIVLLRNSDFLLLLFCKTGQLEHDYESGGTGGNRFATILMYMSDLGPEDGGETVFPHGWPPGVHESKRVSEKAAIEQLRASQHGNILERGSWEEQLVGNVAWH